MSKMDERRKKIFEKYSKQLSDIVKAGLYNIKLLHEHTYMCPICLKQYSLDDLDINNANHLTLEDAPPNSLGGSANTLTCKTCNNSSGHNIDFHLFELLNQLEIRSFSPNIEAKVTVEYKGEKVEGILKIDGEGSMIIKHSFKNNNPEKLEKYIENTSKDDTREIIFKLKKIELTKVGIALLKSAYILAFEHYGYPLILSKAFDVVRAQILKPEQEIYPIGFWSSQASYNDRAKGVHYISSKNYEGLMAIFELRASNGFKKGYGVYLPISIHTYQDVIERLKQLSKGDELEYMSYMDTDYFNNAQNQLMCVKFMEKRNK